MMFTPATPQSLLVCPVCHGVGTIGVRRCTECRGMGVGMYHHDRFVFFGTPLTRYHITLTRARRILGIFEVAGGIIFALGFLGLFAWYVTVHGLLNAVLTPHFWFASPEHVALLFWASTVSWMYVVYRLIATTEPKPSLLDESSHTRRAVDPVMDWRHVRRLSSSRRFDMSRAYTTEARVALEQAFLYADSLHAREVSPEHVLYTLLAGDSVAMIFLRLGISTKVLRAKVAALCRGTNDAHTPVIGSAVQQILCRAYTHAYDGRQQSIYAADMLLATVEESEVLQEVLYDVGVDADKLANVIEWVRIGERLREEYRHVRRASAHVSKYGIDRAMTAVATPFLNSFSQDLTLAAKFGYLTPCVARTRELEEIFRIIDGGHQSVLLVGDAGVGKMTLIEGIAERMIAGDVPKRLHEKRLVQLSTSALLAGTTVEGAEERLIKMMREIARAKNIILFINNIQDLMSVGSASGNAGFDVAKTLAEYVGSGRVMLFATATPEGYNRHIVNSDMGSSFARVDVPEANANQAIQMLEGKAGHIEYEQRVFFAYDAIEAAVTFAERFLHDNRLPESAFTLMTEAATLVRNREGDGHLVRAEDVATVVAEKTGIPTTSLTADESSKLLALETAMHERLVGQDEAVSAVANALRRARAELRSTKRPIANFLFLGPTGVGKTELAKTIAEVYFGGEKQMVRIDMSEFQDTTGVYRLIGEPGKQGTGLLTEPVRQRPFSLVLLDEIEKADPNILNLFLQVMDDGRLTDSVGRVIDFTNTIIIATSNAGTSYVQTEIAKGTDYEVIRQSLLRGALKESFRPEFLNRFDAMVLFRSLNREETKHIASLMLERVAADLDKRGVAIRVSDGALERLADAGFDPEFGARPMRRAIEQLIEDPLASLVLSGTLKRRDTIVVDPDGTLHVESPTK